MAGLTRDEVAALAGALGLPAGPDDIAEVTHRLKRSPRRWRRWPTSRWRRWSPCPVSPTSLPRR